MHNDAVMDDTGSITLPASVIEAMGWTPDQALEISVFNGYIFLEAAVPEQAKSSS